MKVYLVEWYSPYSAWHSVAGRTNGSIKPEKIHRLVFYSKEKAESKVEELNAAGALLSVDVAPSISEMEAE